MKNFVKWCVCVTAVTLCGLNASGQQLGYLSPDRMMLFNDYTGAPGIGNPAQSYYIITNTSGTNFWTHQGDPIPAFGGQAALLDGTHHTFKVKTSNTITSEWVFTDCRLGTPAAMNSARGIPPARAGSWSTNNFDYNSTIITNWMASMRNTTNAMIKTPFYPDGVGTLYFDAINAHPTYTNQLVVEIATNMFDYYNVVAITNSQGAVIEYTYAVTNILFEQETERFSNHWEKVAIIDMNMPANAPPYRFQSTFNHRDAVRFKMTKTITHGTTTPDNYFVVIDNIRVSRPPSEVVLSKTEVGFTPGYPIVGEPFHIRCTADNIRTNEYEKTYAGGGAQKGRSITLHYRWRYLDQVSNAWESVSMSHIPGTGDGNGNGEIWQGEVPSQLFVGDMEYYYTTEFGGYRYSPRDYTILPPGAPAPNDLYWPAKQYNGTTEYSEMLSPRTFRGSEAAPDSREFYVRLRPYPSQFENVSVVTGPPYSDDNPIPMTLISNNVWRGMVPIGNSSGTNLSFYFKGDREYNATNVTINTRAVYWTEKEQALISTIPFGGKLGTTESPRDKPIQVIAEGGGYVQILFDMNEMTYMTSRGEYQNFNMWQAPANVFSDTSGQATKQQFSNTFDSWPNSGLLDGTDIFREYLAGFVPANVGEFVHLPQPTINGWRFGSAASIQERVPATIENRPSTEGPNYGNQAIRLKGGETALNLGYLQNTVTTLPDGLHYFSFISRLGQVVNPYEISYYILGFTNTNYGISANAGAYDTAVLLSPEYPSISLVGYYTGPNSFYEFRLTQTNNATSARCLQPALYKWYNGRPYRLTPSDQPLITGVDRMLTSVQSMELRMYTAGNTTTLSGHYAGNTISANDSGTIGGPVLKRGTCGFLSTECRAGFSNVATYPMLTSTGMGSPSVPILQTATDTLFLGDAANWSLDSERWKVDAGSTPKGIYAVVPKQGVGVYLQKTKYKTAAEPDGPGTPTWELYKEIHMEGFSYQTNMITFKQWRSHYVMLQVMGRSDQQRIDVVVDEMEIAGWRGQTSSDLTLGDTETANAPRLTEWVADEAWVESVEAAGLSEGRVPGSFNRTQINPKTSIQLSTRYANEQEGWITNNTYVYTGRIRLDGSYRFVKNFTGAMLLTIDNQDIIDLDASTPTQTSGTITKGNNWYPFELRVGFGSDGSGGPASSQYNGLGIAYQRNSGPWLPLTDDGTGTGTFLQTDDKQIILDQSKCGHNIDDRGNELEWLPQALRSPLLGSVEMTNGAGLLEFDYKVIRAPAKLTIQYAHSSDETFWPTEIRSWVVSNTMDKFQHELAYIGTNESGFLRVLLDNDNETYTNALVVIKSATAWDEPFVDDTSWRSYNVKVTDTDLQRVMLDETKACFLNNSMIAETDPSQTLYNEAFIKSPMLPTGLGTLSFMARVYTNDQTAALQLRVTQSPNGPRAEDEDWEVVETYTITNNLYETYTYTPADGREFRAFKLVTNTSGTGRRVCVEELAVSEPVFPGFEIAGVFPMCVDVNDYNPERRQPLYVDDVGFQAQLSNIRLTPLDINVFVDYYVGTNYWGVDNWPAGEKRTLKMVLHDIDSQTYRTDMQNIIPALDKNSVVQYCIRAEYKDDNGAPLTVRQREFTNPEWYYPVDLNKKYETQGWSPYYIVYDVPIGAVWINEVNAFEDPNSMYPRTEGGNAFIEIATPIGFDLTGWFVDIVKPDVINGQKVNSTLSIAIPSGIKPKGSSTNGYEFLVIGESTATRDAQVPILENMVLEVLNLRYSWFPFTSWQPGGIRLRRPLGMYEHLVAYGSYGESMGLGDEFKGSTWAAADPEKKFENVGIENKNGSLNVIYTPPGGVPRTNDWAFLQPDAWTPGHPNIGQNVPNATERIPSGASNVTVTASLTPSSWGTQNGVHNQLVFRIKKDQSTNILYQANDWYRLISVTVNGKERLPAEAPTFSLELDRLQTNTTVMAQIALRGDVDSTDIYNNVDILDWLQSFNDKPFAPTWYYGLSESPERELTLLEKFWIDANPTTTNILRGGISKFEVEDLTTNMFLTIRLDLNDANIVNLSGNPNVKNDDAVLKIMAKKRLTDREWTFLQQYRFDVNSFGHDHTAQVCIINPYTTEFTGSGDASQLFIRWVIEYEHPIYPAPILVPTNRPALTPSP